MRNNPPEDAQRCVFNGNFQKPWSFLVAYTLVIALALAGCSGSKETRRRSRSKAPDHQENTSQRHLASESFLCATRDRVAHPAWQLPWSKFRIFRSRRHNAFLFRFGSAPKLLNKRCQIPVIRCDRGQPLCIGNRRADIPGRAIERYQR